MIPKGYNGAQVFEGPYEIEQWTDPMTDNIYIKIRKITDEGKFGIILRVSDESLYQLAEGSIYPTRFLEKVR